MKRIALTDRLANVGRETPDLLASFLCDGVAMVGIAWIAAGSTDKFWERHSNGDELLFLFEGRARFIAVHADGTREVADVGSGDLLLLGRNEAHQAHIEEDLRLLFLTPRDGNTAWTDDPNVLSRH